MNEHHQSKLKQVAGVDIFQRLKIPGFATSGVMDGGFGNRQAVASVTNAFEIKQMVYDAVNSMPQPVVYISDLERIQVSKNKAVNLVAINK